MEIYNYRFKSGNTSSIYKVSGTSLTKVLDISINALASRVFYNDNYFYFADDGYIYSFSETKGLKKISKLTESTLYDFTLNSSNEVILHSMSNGKLYKVIN